MSEPDMQTPPPAVTGERCVECLAGRLDIEAATTFPPFAQLPRRRAPRSIVAAWPACEPERRALPPTNARVTSPLPRLSPSGRQAPDARPSKRPRRRPTLPRLKFMEASR